MENERWLPVVGFEGLYEVSDQGRVRSMPNKKFPTVRILTPSVRKGGYCRQTLTKDGEVSQPCIHRLVLEAFVGPCPECMETRHGDGVRDNNRLSNLCWGTKLENAADRKKHGTQCLGEGHGRAKITEDNVRDIRAARGRTRQIDLAAQYGIAQSKISAIQRGELWKHVA